MEQESLGNNGFFMSLISRGPVPQFWENTKKNLKKNGFSISQDNFYKINSHGLRSQEFDDNHDGLHVLFAGCSNTFGLGSFLEDTWSYKLYKKISEKTKTSGYFNVGSPGATISEIAYQIFVYCKRYGYPDFVFINLPDYYREYQAILDHYVGKEVPENQSLNRVMITRNVAAQYLSLVDNLKLNKTSVVAMTWDTITHFKDSELDVRDNFSDIYFVDNNELAQHCLEYEKNNLTNPLKDFFIRGLDDDHPGIAVHDFWYSKMYNKYKEIINE
jgi:hypothetical protein